MASSAASGVEGDDEIEMRVPVYLRPSDAERALCLFQYPLRPRWRPYNLAVPQKARARPLQRRVELTIDAEFNSQANNDQFEPSPMTSLSLASSTASAKTSYAVGMLRTTEDGTPLELCLTPLDAAVQLRPSFADIDRPENKAAAKDGDDEMADFIVPDGEEEESEDEDDVDVKAEAAGQSVAPQFRPAQTEREIEARRSSHAFLVEQREAEPWSVATLHAPYSEASNAVCEQCFIR